MLTRPSNRWYRNPDEAAYAAVLNEARLRVRHIISFIAGPNRDIRQSHDC